MENPKTKQSFSFTVEREKEREKKRQKLVKRKSNDQKKRQMFGITDEPSILKSQLCGLKQQL